MHKQQQDSGNKMSEAWKHYQGANKDVKKSVRKDKGELVENLAEQIGNEPGQKNMKELCDATRKITGKQLQRPRHFFHLNDLSLKWYIHQVGQRYGFCSNLLL